MVTNKKSSAILLLRHENCWCAFTYGFGDKMEQNLLKLLQFGTVKFSDSIRPEGFSDDSGELNKTSFDELLSGMLAENFTDSFMPPEVLPERAMKEDDFIQISENQCKQMSCGGHAMKAQNANNYSTVTPDFLLNSETIFMISERLWPKQQLQYTQRMNIREQSNHIPVMQYNLNVVTDCVLDLGPIPILENAYLFDIGLKEVISQKSQLKLEGDFKNDLKTSNAFMSTSDADIHSSALQDYMSTFRAKSSHDQISLVSKSHEKSVLRTEYDNALDCTLLTPQFLQIDYSGVCCKYEKASGYAQAINDQIAAKISSIKSTDGSIKQVVMNLEPAHLGAIEITISQNDGKQSIHIIAEKLSSYITLQHNSSHLISMISTVYNHPIQVTFGVKNTNSLKKINDITDNKKSTQSLDATVKYSWNDVDKVLEDAKIWVGKMVYHHNGIDLVI